MKTTKFMGLIIILFLMLASLQVGTVAADDSIITVQLQNSLGSLLPGGSLRYHDGAWNTAVDNGDGTFSVTTAAASVTYEMTYNNGRQTFSNVPVTTNPVIFTTVSTMAALEDSSGGALSSGTVRFHQIGWQNFGNANTALELLPGSYTFEMTYSNGRQTFANYAIPADPFHKVLFTTVTVTPALKDSAANPLGGGTVRFNQIGWENWTDANTARELLPGAYTFEMTYNNGRQTFSNFAIPAGDSYEVPFTTVSTTVALKNSGGTPLAGGTVRYHQIDWKNFGDANTALELLPGVYTFEMTFNNGRQTYANHTVPASSPYEVLFTTVRTEVSLKDSGGSDLPDGKVRFHQIGWQDFGDANTALELLPATYTFEMTYNNGRQTFANHIVPAGVSHEVAFVTTTTTVRLATCSDSGLDGGAIRYHQIGWQDFGITTGGNGSRELLPGAYTFEMTYNNGRQTFPNVTVSGVTQTVPFTTTVVTFDYDGAIQYHQIGWVNFNKPTMDLLPGNYTFKFDALTVSNVAVGGCSMTSGTLTVNFPGINSVHAYVKKADGVPGAANGALVKQLTYKNDAAVFTGVTNGIYDVMVVKGAQTKIIDNVILIGDKSVDNIVATMTVNFPGISGVHTYVKTTGGGDVDNRTYKNDTASLVVLKAPYKVLVVKGAQQNTYDLDCSAGNCTLENIVSTMTVNFPGVFDVHAYVKTTVGGDVDNRTYQDETASLAVLKAFYKVTVVKGAQQNIYDVDCTGATCTLENIVTTLTVNFPGISSVHTYVKTLTNSDVENRTNKNDTTSIALLEGTYRVVVVKGAKQNIIEPVDCTDTGACLVDNIVSTLTINFPGVSGVHSYVKTDDGIAGFGGGDVDNRTYQNNTTSLVLLKGFYDVKVVKGAQANVYESVDCTSLTCSIDNIVAAFTLHFPGKTGVHTYIKTNDGIANSATGGDVDNRTYQNNTTTMTLLKNYYDVVVKVGAETFILDNVNCTGNTCVYSLTVVKLLNSGGIGLPGGFAEYYNSGWKPIGTTPSNGVLSFAMPGAPATYSFRMSYAGASQQKSNINIATTNPVIFQTLAAAVHFQNSSSAPLAGGVIDYYASGWKTFGSGLTNAAGDASMEVLPGLYSFRMSWAGAAQQLSSVNIATTNPVLFQTISMVVHFKDSTNTPLINGVIDYYASGWKTLGSGLTDAAGNASMDLLPGIYSFRMSWAGASLQKSNINIMLTNPLDFQTLSVYARLEQKTTNAGIPGGVAKYYASGWKNLGTTDTNGNTPSFELLPGVYSFNMTYTGATEQKSNIDITTTNPVVFQTVNEVMSVALKNSVGDPLAGGVVRYYASGWKDFGTTDSSGIIVGPDLLPGKYSFQLTYGGYTQQKSNVDITLDANKPLVYTTINMLVAFKNSNGNPIQGGVVRYYASGWKDFGTTDVNGEARFELLPGTYSFQMTYGGYTQQLSNINIETTNPLAFQTVEMTVKFKDSTNAPLGGGAVKYYASGWKDFGITNASGEAKLQLLPGVYSFQLTWAGYTEQKSNITTSTSPLEFQTVDMEVKLTTCNSTGLEGGAVKYYASGWKTFGTTDVNGSASLELLPGSYSFQMTWAGQTEQRTNVNIASTNPLVYNTTSVTLQYPGTIQYYASGWKTFTSPMELLPYNYTFKFGSYQTPFNVSGCSMTNSVIILSLKDHAGNGLAGGTARGGYGSNYSTWFVPGSTPANGLLFVYQPGLQTTMSYEMRYNNTTQVKTQDVSVNPLFEFNTNLLTLRLETCSGSPLDGGNPRGGYGSNYTTWWFPGGTTGSSASGETKAEFFPGIYSFEMQYKATADPKVSVTIPDADTLLTWQTTNVTLGYEGQISYGGGTGDSTFLTKPSMELLPGTYKFNFRPDNRVDLTLSGCSFNKSFVALKVLDENGNGVPGGKATPAYGGSWGTTLTDVTDANGKLFTEIPAGFTKIRMEVNQGSVEQTTAQLTASNYTWYTEILRIWLNDHAGAAITDGNAVLDQGGGFWYSWGNLNASGYRDIQLFARPSAYKFRMNYNFTTQEQLPIVSTTPGIDNFNFQTGQVFGPCITQYSTGAWRTFTNGMELMPGTYNFKSPSQQGAVTAGGVTYLTGCSGVSGSGTIGADFSSPTVTFSVFEGAPDSGVFSIVYAGPQGTYGETGTTVTGQIICLNIIGTNAYLGGLVTQTNSPDAWQVGQYLRFGVSPSMLNFTVGEAAMPNCTSDGIEPSLPLVGGGYSIIQ